METTTATKIRAELDACIKSARAQGWDGEPDTYTFTEFDLVSVIDAIGHKPTREEWADAGLPGIGHQHVSDERE